MQTVGCRVETCVDGASAGAEPFGQEIVGGRLMNQPAPLQVAEDVAHNCLVREGRRMSPAPKCVKLRSFNKRNHTGQLDFVQDVTDSIRVLFPQVGTTAMLLPLHLPTAQDSG